MRILLTIHAFKDINSGAPGSVLRLAEEYRRMGHAVRILSYDDLPSRVPARLRPLVFPWFVFSRVRRLAGGLDVVDALSGDAWLCTLRRDRGRRRPLFVAHSQGLEHPAQDQVRAEARAGRIRLSWRYPLYHGGYRLWEVARSFRQADLSFFLNRPDLEYAVTRLGVRRDRARVLANGLPAKFLGRPFEATPESLDAGVGIAQVGTYTLRKGIAYGTPALNAVLKEHVNVHVSFLGTGCPPGHVLRDFEPEVRRRVAVVPRYEQADLPALLHGHYIKLFPTLSEGFGNALLEAMSCGLAPVATATPGPLEFVRDGCEGLIVPPRDSAALERALRQLLYDRALLDRLRRRAHAKAQSYSWARIAAERLHTYEEFAPQPRSEHAAVTAMAPSANSCV